MIIKPNWNKFKEKFSIIDNFFGWFQSTKIGKHYLKGTSFFKILFFFGSILVAQVSAISNLISLTSKVETQLANSEGFIYIGWFILSLFIPDGNWFLIVILFLILLGAFIVKYREPKEKTIEDILLKSLRAKAKTLLFEIKTSIRYNNQTIVINRDEVINDISKELKNKQIIILSGVGGVGKTSVIKKIYEERDDKSAFYLFRATEFKNRDLIKDYSLQEFMEVHQKIEDKIVVIDSSEKLFDDIDEEFFKEFLSSLIRNEWKVIFTIRDSYLDMLNYQFIEVYELKPFHIHINNLNIEELSDFAKEFDFILPTDEKLIELIKNPFYLHEYLRFYNENKTIDYKAFKNKLWDKNINKSNENREECFLELARKRAEDGQFFISDIKCKSGSLHELKKDGILGKETAGYFITHDIYEEWALEKIIDSEFIKRENSLSFFQNIGSSLPIRRSFRNWVSEQLLLDSEDIKLFIEKIIDDNEIEQFWKDEVFVSILLSDYSDTFFEYFERELLADDYALLKRISFLLQLACKEADNSLSQNYKTILFTQPMGRGWKSFIKFAYKHIDFLGINSINHLLPILYTWNSKHHKGKVTKRASLIALKYYELIETKKYKYSYDEYIDNLCYVILSGTYTIKDKLALIFNEVLENKYKERDDKYYQLSVRVLSTSYGVPKGTLVLKYIHEYAIKLAKLFWVDIPILKEKTPWYENDTVEMAYGLEKYGLEYYPVSAYQTPIYYLLKFHFIDTIDFLLEFINQSVEKYSQSGWEEKVMKKGLCKVDLYIKNKTYRQYHSQGLWNIYRRTSSPVSPDLLQSIHMALEKYLLEIAKFIDNNLLEHWLIYLLKNSKSSSISALVTSIVLAHPDKTFNVALILFKTKEFFEADLGRLYKEHEAKFLYGMGYKINGDKYYQDERLKTCEDKHRKLQLENLFLNYQLFRTEEIEEKKAQKRVKKLWDILDNYYKELPKEEEQTESDKTWQMFLARMDVRGLDISMKEVEKGIHVTFTPELSPKLQEFSEQSVSESEEVRKYTPLFIWSKYKIENNKDYKKYKDFEDNPLLALQQLKEIRSMSNDEKEKYLLLAKTPVHISIILLEEQVDKLLEEDKEVCRDIIIEFSFLPFSKNYHYQVTDGVASAISYLPILLINFSNLENDIKVVLLLHLFNDYPTNNAFYNYSIIAIHKYFNEEDIKSFLFAYLILKPKYDNEIEKIIRETGEQRFPMIDKEERFNNFIQENEATIEKMISNQISFVDIEDISKLELYMLNVAFRIIPLESEDIEYKTIQKEIINTFSLNLFDIQRQNRHHSLKDKYYRIPYEIKQKFIEKLSDLVLQLKIDDIPLYLQPLIDNFKKKKVMAKFFTKLIYTQDRVKKYNNFWHIWELFENTIVKLCEDGEGHYSKEIVQAYLFADVMWNENAKTWHTLKEKDKRFFKRMSEKIGHCPSTLYSISKLLTDIGSSYLNDGIGWISYMVKNNKNLLTDKLEPDTIFNLEIITRKYVLQNSQEIKKSKPKKEEVLEILNFLVEKGSAVGYMLRERFL